MSSGQGTSEFKQLLNRVRDGDADAAWQLLETYGPHIRAVIRGYLDRKTRVLYESDDFVQAVWASLFRIQDRLSQVSSPEGFVAVLARNKIIQELRKRKQTQAYNINRQVSLDQSNLPGNALVDPKPRPSEWAVARELWQELLDGESETTRRVVQLRISGAKYREIAEELEIHERSARRMIERLLEKHRNGGS